MRTTHTKAHNTEVGEVCPGVRDEQCRSGRARGRTPEPRDHIEGWYVLKPPHRCNGADIAPPHMRDSFREGRKIFKQRFIRDVERPIVKSSKVALLLSSGIAMRIVGKKTIKATTTPESVTRHPMALRYTK